MRIRSSYRQVLTLCVWCSASACNDIDGTPFVSKAAAATEPTLQEPAPLAPAPSRMPLGERLAREATDRPELAVRPERLFEQLALEDVELLRTRQAVGATLGASYCVTSTTSEGLGLAVCEFVNEASSAQGEARSHELFDRLIAGRTLVRNANTLLTLTAAQTAQAKTESARAVAIFESLSPEQRAMP